MDIVKLKRNTDAIFEVLEKEGLWKDLPVFGQFYKLAAATQSVADHIFLSKLKLFIDDLMAVSDKDILQISNMLRFDDDEEIARKVLLVVDSLTDTQKSRYISQAINLYSNKELTKSDFLRSVDLIQSMFIEDIITIAEYFVLGNFTTYEDLINDQVHFIINTPLIRQKSISEADLQNRAVDEEGKFKTYYEETEFASIFRMILLNKPPYTGVYKKRLQSRGLL